VRALCAVIAAASAASGCVYGFKSLSGGAGEAGVGVPTDAGAEARRRASRRRWALLGGALEVGLGSLVRYAYTRSDKPENRAFLGAVSESLIAVGAGDLVLASIDALLATPFVDERGAFRSPAHFREPMVPPSRLGTPRDG
jgi:hypothetical protein